MYVRFHRGQYESNQTIIVDFSFDFTSSSFKKLLSAHAVAVLHRGCGDKQSYKSRKNTDLVLLKILKVVRAEPLLK